MIENRPNLPQATYIAQLLPDFQGNPLIEALPPVASAEELMRKIMVRPPYSEAERELPKEWRLLALARLKNMVIPLTHYFPFETTFSRLLRFGYVARNPMLPNTWRTVYSARDAPYEPVVASHLGRFESQMAVMGLSGMGKSTMVESLLRAYGPQVVYHTNYGGRELKFPQIKWIKLDCPSNASIATLCREFFEQVDLALGIDKYRAEYSGSHRKQDQLESGMRQVAASFFLGVLVIDEIQNLNLAKTGGAKGMMAFLHKLRDRLGVPIIHIGTYAAIGLFSAEMKDARRASECGLFEIKRPTSRTNEWDGMVKKIWRYQWLKRLSPLSDEMLDTFFDLTQGINDFVPLLYKLVQEQAIRDEHELINTEFVRRVFYDKLGLLVPAINALRSNNEKELARFEDLLPPREKLSRLFNVLNSSAQEVDEHIDQILEPKTAANESPSLAAEDAESDGTSGKQNRPESVVALPAGYRDLREFSGEPDTHKSLTDAGVMVVNPFDIRASCFRKKGLGGRR